MPKNIITLPTVLANVSDRADRSSVLKFETRELTRDEFGELRDLRGLEGWLAFSIAEVQTDDIPDSAPEVGQKTPSQRLRNAIFVWYKQEVAAGNTRMEFETFYRSKMEGIITLIKNKLK